MKWTFIAVALSAIFVGAASAAPETFTIDTPHSFSHFEVTHLGINTIQGRFDKTSGEITLDRAAKQGSIQAEIDVNSVSTGYARRDDLLKTDDYFNAAKFPTMTFRSKTVRFKDDTLVGADGELTLLGVTRPVSLEIMSFKCITHPVNKRELCGAVARTTIKRSDFGMTRASRSLSDEIRISINLEALKSS
jgi:polyisoprenoid-binding protein YceI